MSKLEQITTRKTIVSAEPMIAATLAGWAATAPSEVPPVDDAGAPGKGTDDNVLRG